MKPATVALLATVLATQAGCDYRGPEDFAPRDRLVRIAPSAAPVRAERRLYDGAPPVIPHMPFSSPCLECHSVTGMAVANVGFAPPSPHENTGGLGTHSRCAQCHVYASDTPDFTANDFVALRQDLRSGRRLNAYAPPVVPHAVFMRENCKACHTGLAAREQIRTSHPERTRCLQCHVERTTVATFAR